MKFILNKNLFDIIEIATRGIHSSKILFKSNLNEIFLIHWLFNHDNDRTKNRFSTW